MNPLKAKHNSWGCLWVKSTWVSVRRARDTLDLACCDATVKMVVVIRMILFIGLWVKAGLGWTRARHSKHTWTISLLKHSVYDYYRRSDVLLPLNNTVMWCCCTYVRWIWTSLSLSKLFSSSFPLGWFYSKNGVERKNKVMEIRVRFALITEKHMIRFILSVSVHISTNHELDHLWTFVTHTTAIQHPQAQN